MVHGNVYRTVSTQGQGGAQAILPAIEGGGEGGEVRSRAVRRLSCQERSVCVCVCVCVCVRACVRACVRVCTYITASSARRGRSDQLLCAMHASPPLRPSILPAPPRLCSRLA